MMSLRFALAACVLSIASVPSLADATAAAGAHAGSAKRPSDADNAYLEKLLGQWEMTGSMGSKALHYRARGERVLQGGFLRLHMVDAAPVPQYEADVFIGVDPQQHDFVAHWLDRFGAAGARVVGSGKRDDARLVMIFPYVDGAFRDTFTFKPDDGSWSLLLESQKADGSWSTFANYNLIRAP